MKYDLLEAVLEITLSCNMRCLHCGSTATGINRKDPITLEEWYKVIDDLNRLKVTGITLSGGEPFVYPHWRELISYIHKVNPKIVKMIITNAYNIKEEDIKFLKDIGLGHLGISIDGNEEIHDFIRQTKGSFKKSNQVMDWCDKYGVKYTIVTAINKHNFHIRGEMLAWIKQRKPKTWQVQVVNSFGRAGEFREAMLISHEQYALLTEDIVKWHKENKPEEGGIEIISSDCLGYCHPLTDSLYDEDSEWQGCNAGISVIGIESNGNVKGCLSLQDDYFISGNVKNRSLFDIWNDDNSFPYTRNYDVSKISGCCKNCEVFERCKAGCLGFAYSVFGNIYENSYCYRNIRGIK
jgi:radical SAM protein with 4Fe4S-binding SPASM domain